MTQQSQTVVGIDVGGPVKGFHAVALRKGTFEKTTSAEPAEIVAWCRERKASIIAVDAPCGWSQSGPSRSAEGTLEIAGARIQCFSTPTRACALAHPKGFYDWVLNGEKLYASLMCHYPLFDGKRRKGPVCFETFPHAIACAFAGELVSARPKATKRRRLLSQLGYDPSSLPNIDFVDAALCAVVAEEFRWDRTRQFGGLGEGFIVVPARQLGRSPPPTDC